MQLAGSVELGGGAFPYPNLARQRGPACFGPQPVNCLVTAETRCLAVIGCELQLIVNDALAKRPDRHGASCHGTIGKWCSVGQATGLCFAIGSVLAPRSADRKVKRKGMLTAIRNQPHPTLHLFVKLKTHALSMPTETTKREPWLASWWQIGGGTELPRAHQLHRAARSKAEAFANTLSVASAASCTVWAAAVDAVVDSVTIGACATSIFAVDCFTNWWHIACGQQLAFASVATVFDEWHFVRWASWRNDVAGDGASAAASAWQFTGVAACVGVDGISVVAFFAFAGVDDAVAAFFIRLAIFRAAVAVNLVAVVANFTGVEGAVAACCGWAWNAGVGCQIALLVSSAIRVFGALVGIWHARRPIWIALEAGAAFLVSGTEACFLAGLVACAVAARSAISVGRTFVHGAVAGRREPVTTVQRALICAIVATFNPAAWIPTIMVFT